MDRLWLKCDNIKELKNTYKTYKNLCDSLDKELKGIIKFPKKSWVKTFEFLSVLKKIIKEENKNTIDLEREKYIWTLCYTDGMTRANLLGITIKHYESKKLAKKWRNEILKMVAPDKNNQSKESNIATSKLNDLYEGMIKDGK